MNDTQQLEAALKLDYDHDDQVCTSDTLHLGSSGSITISSDDDLYMLNANLVAQDININTAKSLYVKGSNLTATHLINIQAKNKEFVSTSLESDVSILFTEGHLNISANKELSVACIKLKANGLKVEAADTLALIPVKKT